jgi:hypothetical protein
MDDITRETLDGIGPDGVDVRLYTHRTHKLPSVTTILKTRDDDKSNLYDWQDRNDGEGNAANYEHLFWYSRQIGTLGHWHALSHLDPDLEWTKDEARSLAALRHVGEIDSDEIYRFHDERLGHDITLDGEDHEEIHDASPREVLYSAMRGDKNKGGGTVASWGEFYDKHSPFKNNDYYSDELVAWAKRDIEFFTDGQKRLWSKLDIDRESVIEVEKFLFVTEHGYAGQVDLVYEDRDGYVVVADLKSSSGCYDKHQIQGSAYGKAIELADDVDVDEVDRLEVHRCHPRTGQMAVHTHRDAPGKQTVHTTQYWRDGYDDLWQQFRSLADNFEYVDPEDIEISVDQ